MVMYERAIHDVNIVDTWSKCPWKRNIFLRPLIDELKELWKDGVLARVAVDGKGRKVRAALLWTVNDVPAQSIFSVGLAKDIRHVLHIMMTHIP